MLLMQLYLTFHANFIIALYAENIYIIVITILTFIHFNCLNFHMIL